MPKLGFVINEAEKEELSTISEGSTLLSFVLVEVDYNHGYRQTYTLLTIRWP